MNLRQEAFVSGNVPPPEQTVPGVGSPQDRPDSNSGAIESLRRGLSFRHLQLIAIGGTIGTGLFLGSGKAINLAGPSIIFVYAIIGFMLFFVMRAMGELLLSNLNYKSFIDFTEDLLGPWAGFFTGWTYWFCWIVTVISEIIAISGFVLFWWHDIPLWVPAAIAIVALLALNLPTVTAFGEIEFWFALIKIVAILTLIVVGLVLIFMAFPLPGGGVASFANIWNDNGMFPNGFVGFVAGFQVAVFSFVGLEMVGTAAAETKDPRRNLPRAINAIPLRLVLFYVLSIAIIISVTPWSQIVPDKSPFVAMFILAGVTTAAGIINFVVLTSASSSANSGIYSTSRMLFGLAKAGDAYFGFGRLSSRRVPANALVFSSAFLLLAVALLYAGRSVMEAFTMTTTLASLLFIFVWSMILFAYIAYRKRRPRLHAQSSYKMPGGVAMCFVVLAFFAFVLWALSQKEDTLFGLFLTPIWFAVLGFAYSLLRKNEWHRVRREEFAKKVRDELAAR